MVVDEEVGCTNGTWINQLGHQKEEESILRFLEMTCSKNDTEPDNGCTSLQGDNFKATCTGNVHWTPTDNGIFTSSLQKNSICSLACKSDPEFEIDRVECIGNNLWRQLGDTRNMQLNSEQVLKYTKTCRPINTTCPAFERRIPSGVWECRSVDDDIADGQWTQSNTECELKCEGDQTKSLVIKCEKGAWKVHTKI